MTDLTIHTQQLEKCMPLIRQKKPGYVVAIDPDLASVVECRSLGVRVIARMYDRLLDGGNAENFISPDDYIKQLAEKPWFSPDGVWGVTTPNEPHPGSVEFLETIVGGVEERGIWCVVGNWGTGWDGFYVPGATYYGCHEYGWPHVTSQQPYQAYRHSNFNNHDREQPGAGWFEKLVIPRNGNARLFITEFGVTRAASGASEDVGYHSADMDHVLVALDYRGYVAGLKPYVLAAAAFNFASYFPYESFELLGTAVENTITGRVEHQINAEANEELVFSLGFKELYEKLGHDVVGNPTTRLTYTESLFGGSMAIQLTERGYMLWEQSTGQSFFFRAAR